MWTATTMPVFENESLNDDEFLDRLFELAIDQLENGRSPLPVEIPTNRAHLRDDIARLVRVAQAISTSPPADLPTLRDYTLIRELGRGGMGSVHLARQERLGRLVALKLMPRASALSARARGRFLSEAQAIANLQHPNVVAIHDVIEEDGVLAYAMEWVEGCTLAEAIDAAANSRAGPGGPDDPAVSTSDPEIGYCLPLDPASVARLGVAVARALAVVHAAGLVHRDVKPSNILLRRDATPLLSDFGLVRAADSSDLTQTGQFLGTLAYAAPEQLRGESDAIDARSDVYALGATLYHALALQRPFSDPSPKRQRAGPADEPNPHNSPAIMLRRIEAGLAAPLRRQNPLVPRDFETIITKAMDPNPARRYQTAADLADDLERMLTLRPIQARKAGVFSRATKLARRHRGVLAASVLGAAAALGLAVATVVYVFFVPRWVEAHVREARLTLLHPDQANGIISQLFWGNSPPRPDALLGADRSIYAGALREYDAALRLAPFDEALRQEREVVAGVVRGEAAHWSDPRSAGLRDYLLFNPAGAIEAWTRWEQSRPPLAPADPMIDAALGVLYLADDQPARAYPRLNDACRAFPDVGFLTVYLADAAVQCGDFARAEQLLRHAETLAQHDPLGALYRVRADLLAATGQDAEAEAAYRAAVLYGLGLGTQNFAIFLESRGRGEEAVEWYAMLARGVPSGTKPARAFVAAMDGWWGGLPGQTRLARIRAALDEHPSRPNSLLVLLQQYEQSRAVLRPNPKDEISNLKSGIQRIPSPKSSPIAALRAWFSSPPLQNVTLHELALRMEVENMSFWSNLVAFARVVKELVYSAWRWPWLRSVIRPVVDSELRIMRRRAQIAAVLMVAGGSAVARAQPVVDFLFSTDGVRPTSDPAVVYFASGGTPEFVTYPSVSGGMLYQRAFERGDNGAYIFRGGNNNDAAGFSPHDAYVMEVRVEMLRINGLLGTYLDFGNGSNRYLLSFSNNGVYLLSDAGYVFVDGDIYRPRTYRLESQACGSAMTLSIDGVPKATVTAPASTLNHVQIAAGCRSCGTAGDAIWDYVVFSRIPGAGQPDAEASDDQSVFEGESVTLDGSATLSPCGTPTYTWTQLAGTIVTLDLTDPVHPNFTAPLVPMGGETLTFQLVVSDGSNISEPDSVNVTVTNVNHAPVAVADGPAAVAEGGLAALDGSHSYDDDDEPLTFSWQQVGGTPVTLSDDTSAMPTFTAPFVGFGGETLTFQLIVSDGTDSSVPDVVEVTITNVNTLPVASAGVPQTRNEGAAISLDASASHDDDGDTLTYAWTQISGAAVTLTGGSSASPTFTAPQVGVGGDTLVFRVCVDDGYGGSDCDEVAITVQNVMDGNSPPACNLARPSVAELWPPNHKMVAISVLGVTDPDNNGISITILDVTQDEPIDGLGDGDTSPDAVIQGGSVLLRAERAGNRNGRVYRVTFQADDGLGGTCTGTVHVCVPHSKGRNAPPCVDDGQLYQSDGQ